MEKVKGKREEVRGAVKKTAVESAWNLLHCEMRKLECKKGTTEEPATLGCPSLVPGTVVVHDETGAPKASLEPLIKRCAKTPQTIVMQTTHPSGRCLSAEWLAESAEHRSEAFLYDDKKMVCRITFYDGYQSRNIGFIITKQALHGLVSRAGHMARYRANKNAKEGGAK